MSGTEAVGSGQGCLEPPRDGMDGKFVGSYSCHKLFSGTRNGLGYLTFVPGYGVGTGIALTKGQKASVRWSRLELNF